jgi:hypothetical protein
MDNMNTATTILQQLGGQRFIAMTGAKNILGGAAELQFHLPAKFAAKGINAVRVELTANDDYRVKFYKIGRGLKCAIVAEFDGIYANQLRDVFTATTGLQTSLGTMQAGR